MAGTVSIDTSDLRKLARDLRRANPELLKRLQQALRKGAEIVSIEAKLIAGFYSSSIPPTIRPFTRGLDAGVRAGNARVPLATLFEHGGEPGTFRHPVFGNMDVWRPQAAHPFLALALAHEFPKVEATALDEVENVFRTIGFH